MMKLDSPRKQITILTLAISVAGSIALFQNCAPQGNFQADLSGIHASRASSIGESQHLADLGATKSNIRSPASEERVEMEVVFDNNAEQYNRSSE